MLSIIPNYLYKEILKPIIQYFYNKQSNFSLFYYEPFIQHYANYVIDLSLVNKKFFQMISELLKDILNFKNYKALSQFMVSIPTLDKKFKLINNYNFVKVIDNYEMEKYNIKYYNKILYQHCKSFQDTLPILNGTKKLPPNVELMLYLKLEKENEIDLERILNKQERDNEINTLVCHTFILLEYYYSNINLELIGKLIDFLRPINVVFCGERFSLRQDKSIFFNQSTESLNISSNIIKPIEVSNIKNEKTNLKSLSITLSLNGITRGINGCYPRLNDNSHLTFCDFYNVSKSSINIKQDYISMIKTLSNNKTIMDLHLNEICSYGCGSECINGLNTTFVSSGLAKLFSSSTNIKTLLLEGINYTDKNYLNSLVINKTINTLLLFSIKDLNPIFNNVLSKTRTINNIIIGEPPIKIMHLEELLTKYSESIDLYSLSISLYKDDDIKTKLNLLINKINTFKILNIKELNIYISNSNGYNTSKFFLKNNNQTILNIIYYNYTLIKYLGF
ncbi:hypothetical protein ACTA71_009832 [Dictyostelium dimigraforme]